MNNIKDLHSYFSIHKEPVDLPKDSVVHLLKVLQVPAHLDQVPVNGDHLGPHVPLMIKHINYDSPYSYHHQNVHEAHVDICQDPQVGLECPPGPVVDWRKEIKMMKISAKSDLLNRRCISKL